jgi:hypothetical protein
MDRSAEADKKVNVRRGKFRYKIKEQFARLFSPICVVFPVNQIKPFLHKM